MTLMYFFETPEEMEVHEEYIVVPAFKMIGDIGGTISIFIGIAFSPTVTQLLEYCRYFVYMIYAKCFAGKSIYGTDILLFKL